MFTCVRDKVCVNYEALKFLCFLYQILYYLRFYLWLKNNSDFFIYSSAEIFNMQSKCSWLEGEGAITAGEKQRQKSKSCPPSTQWKKGWQEDTRFCSISTFYGLCKSQRSHCTSGRHQTRISWGNQKVTVLIDVMRWPLCLTQSGLAPGSNHMHPGGSMARGFSTTSSSQEAEQEGDREKQASSLQSPAAFKDKGLLANLAGQSQIRQVFCDTLSCRLPLSPPRLAHSLLGWEGKLPGTLGPTPARAGRWGAAGLPSSPLPWHFTLQQQCLGPAPATLPTALFLQATFSILVNLTGWFFTCVKSFNCISSRDQKHML